MQGRNFIRIAGGGVIAAATVPSAGLAGCSPAMPRLTAMCGAGC
jgi:hypothetical protein